MVHDTCLLTAMLELCRWVWLSSCVCTCMCKCTCPCTKVTTSVQPLIEDLRLTHTNDDLKVEHCITCHGRRSFMPFDIAIQSRNEWRHCWHNVLWLWSINAHHCHDVKCRRRLMTLVVDTCCWHLPLGCCCRIHASVYASPTTCQAAIRTAARWPSNFTTLTTLCRLTSGASTVTSDARGTRPACSLTSANRSRSV